MVRVVGVYSGYFICYDNDEERDALTEKLRLEGYSIQDVSHHYTWKKGRYNYSPLIINTINKIVYGINTTCAAGLSSKGIRSYTPHEFMLMMQYGFKLQLPDVLFHIPHDGCEFPKELMPSLNVSGEIFRGYHEQMRDFNVSCMIPGAYRHLPYFLMFPVSRLLCDVERFTGPEEVMEKYGMGYCYSKAYDGRRIKRVYQKLKDLTMVYYRQHHEALDAAAERFENLLLIDLHSYSEETMPKGYLESITDAAGQDFAGPPDSGDLKMPDICIGTDPVYTPVYIAEEAQRLFEEAGFRVMVNFPYQGCMVPNAVLQKKTDHTFAGIMLEVNKQVYLDEKNEVIEENAGKIRQVIKKLILSYSESELREQTRADSLNDANGNNLYYEEAM